MYDPIPNMSTNELLVKRVFDEYKLNTLKDNPLNAIKKYGFNGLDESLFSLKYLVTGLRKKKLTYFEQQIQLTDAELKNRTDSGSFRTEQLLAITPNPATFNVLKEEREKLKLERILEGISDAEISSPYERYVHSKEKIKDQTNLFLSSLGNVGEHLKINTLFYATAVALIICGYSGYKWSESKKIYDPIAKEYILSHEVAESSLMVKRGMDDDFELTVLNLTHTDEMTIEINDSEITIPEKPSAPQSARYNIKCMNETLNSATSNTKLKTFTSLWPDDLEKIALIREDCKHNFEIADASLMFQTDNSITYTDEIVVVTAGYLKSKKIVEILEDYIPKAVVSKENAAYDNKTFWKWFTRIFGAIGGIGIYSMFKTGQSLKVRRKYYGDY
ncbi:MAG: hypothetical protein ACP5N2_03475 [Candidatus Nanoarchaeia archaeon]